jgi:hypothetical protein
VKDENGGVTITLSKTNLAKAKTGFRTRWSNCRLGKGDGIQTSGRASIIGMLSWDVDFDMKYVCGAPDCKTWFQFETEVEADRESALMDHAVAKYFKRERTKAAQSYRPLSTTSFEQKIGLESHIRRQTPLFLTLRDAEGNGLATAMLPPGGRDDPGFKIIIVGKRNSDPYPQHESAIHALSAHFGFALDRGRCFPYGR